MKIHYLRLLSFFCIVFTLAAFSAPVLYAQDEQVNTIPEADPNDVKSIDAIINAVYDVISGPAEKERDWNRFKSLFRPDAKLIPLGPNNATYFTLDGYITRNTPSFRKNGFFEREIHRVVEQFRDMAHVFSTYAAFRKKDETQPFTRGINSIQLARNGGRWWIVNIFWQGEHPSSPIPEKYLPKGGEK